MIGHATVTSPAWGESAGAIVRDDHAACSYGQPVLFIAGTPYGPGDLPSGTTVLMHVDVPGMVERDTEDGKSLARRMRDVGYRVEELSIDL